MNHKEFTEPLEVAEDRREENLSIQRSVLDQIIQEREYQRSRWGSEHDLQHTKEDWLVILMAYVGKMAAECHPYRDRKDPEALKAVRKRFAQAAAISAAAMEALERLKP